MTGPVQFPWFIAEVLVAIVVSGMSVAAGKLVEIYDCGCLVRLYSVDHGERDDLPEKPFTVTELIPCRIHDGKTSDRPRDSRLVRLRGEPESYLNE